MLNINNMQSSNSINPSHPINQAEQLYQNRNPQDLLKSYCVTESQVVVQKPHMYADALTWKITQENTQWQQNKKANFLLSDDDAIETEEAQSSSAPLQNSPIRRIFRLLKKNKRTNNPRY